MYWVERLLACSILAPDGEYRHNGDEELPSRAAETKNR